MTDEPMVLLESVRFAYPGPTGFSLFVPRLSIGRGERVACIGPSGTGKTTLINLIAGILPPHEGRVEVDGREISSLDESQRRLMRIERIGMVFQEFELLEYLSAEDNVLLPFHVSGRLRLTSSVRARAKALGTATGIRHVLRRRPGRLSQGERQRVAICRALVTQPSLILCDEPTGNLDPVTANSTLDLLFGQVAEHDATLLMVTHNHSILARFDRVIDVSEFGSAGEDAA